MNVRTSIFRHAKLLTEYTTGLNTKRTAFKVISRPADEKLKDPVFSNAPSVAIQVGQRIKLSGPMTVADYMKMVLTSTVGGYYMSKDVFGKGGDFITSPEINQIFGEMLGIWLVAEWQKLGAPKPFQIVEFGPGRGTLMSDVLKIFHTVGIEPDDFSMHLIEVSPVLQRFQADRLCLSHKQSESQPYYYEGETVRGGKVYWYKNIESVPKGFSLYTAHEFFDVLPIHKFKKTSQGWREILIDFDPSSNDEQMKLRYVLSKEETVATKLYSKLANNDLEDFEVSPEALLTMNKLASRIDEDGGIGIVIDYGENGANGDTFRGYQNHKQVDALHDVGNADLTADVNFALLKNTAQIARVFGPISQRSFLLATKADARLKAILEKASPEKRENFKASYDMLVDPERMGQRFKFMAVFPTITDEHYKQFPVLGF